MRILGIDPGSRKTGWGVIELHGRKIHYVASGVFEFYKEGQEFLDRFGVFFDAIKNIVEKYAPNEVALESLIFKKSPTALIKLAQARGAMLAAFHQSHQGRVFEYSPNLIKSTAAGYGHASKDAVQKMIQMLISSNEENSDLEFFSDDESDALAVALCHAFQRDNLRAKLKSGASQSGSNKKRTLKNSLSHLVRDV